MEEVNLGLKNAPNFNVLRMSRACKDCVVGGFAPSPSAQCQPLLMVRRTKGTEATASLFFLFTHQQPRQHTYYINHVVQSSEDYGPADRE